MNFWKDVIDVFTYPIWTSYKCTALGKITAKNLQKRGLYQFICTIKTPRVSLKDFGKDLKDPRSDKIYSSGNRGVDEEFLVPSLLETNKRRKTDKK